MNDTDQLQIIKEGVECWNAWRNEHRTTRIRLRDADLRGLDLSHVNFNDAILDSTDLSGVDLSSARMSNARMGGVNLSGANLSYASLIDADLIDADLRCATLRHACIIGADLSGAKLCGADLRDAELQRVKIIETDFSDANLDGCWVYGISAWGVKLDGANQENLRITPHNEPVITVDDLEVAQFIYLMLNNQKVRQVINTISTKAVLILGRFTQEHKATLDAVREELRRQDYLPIIFDFNQPATRDLTETVSTLAHLARFIIADITSPRSIPQELHAIIPHLPSVPVQPLRLATASEYGMFEHFKQYPWVLETHIYESRERLIAELKEKVIAPAEAKAKGTRG